MTNNAPKDKVAAIDEILEIIKGFEPVAKLDGKGGEVPLGYDLNEDERTEFGFYWEYEDMERCAVKTAQALYSLLAAEAVNAYWNQELRMSEGLPTKQMFDEKAIPLSKLAEIFGQSND